MPTYLPSEYELNVNVDGLPEEKEFPWVLAAIAGGVVLILILSLSRRSVPVQTS